MRHLMTAVVVAAALLGACRAVPVDEGGRVDWSRGYLVVPAPGSPAVVYLSVANPTGQGDTVTAVRVATTDSAQMHRTMAMGDGMEHMQPVSALPLPAHDTVKFAPGGLHIMVFGVGAGVRPGDSAAVTVRFLRAGEITHWARVITYAQVDSAVRR